MMMTSNEYRISLPDQTVLEAIRIYSLALTIAMLSAHRG